MKEKLTTLYSVSSLGKYMFKHKKGYSYSNKSSITSVMHFKDIQKVILRYITVTYPG